MAMGNLCKMQVFKIGGWKVALILLSVTPGAAHSAAQSATRQEMVSFIQNAIATKAGGGCAASDTSVSPVYTPYGAIGGGTISSSSQKLYLSSNSMISPAGELHLTFIDVIHMLSPNAIGLSDSTFATLSDETITLSSIAPNSIAAINGSCGAGVKFTGTNGGIIGTNRMRNRKMKGAVHTEDIPDKVQAGCTDKEVKKRDCTEKTFSLTEETIYFPNDPDMANRFAAALTQLVTISGGRGNIF